MAEAKCQENKLKTLTFWFSWWDLQRKDSGDAHRGVRADGPGEDCSPIHWAYRGSVCRSPPAAGARAAAGLHTYTPFNITAQTRLQTCTACLITTELIICYSIATWFGNLSGKLKSQLQNLIKSAGKIIGILPPSSIQEIFEETVRKQGLKMTCDLDHIFHKVWADAFRQKLQSWCNNFKFNKYKFSLIPISNYWVERYELGVCVFALAFTWGTVKRAQVWLLMLNVVCNFDYACICGEIVCCCDTDASWIPKTIKANPNPNP